MKKILLYLTMMLPMIGNAQNKKISELDPIVLINGGEVFPVAYSGSNYKMSLNQMKEWITTIPSGEIVYGNALGTGITSASNFKYSALTGVTISTTALKITALPNASIANTILTNDGLGNATWQYNKVRDTLIQLSALQIANFHTNAIDVVPSAGANKGIYVIGGIGYNDFNTIAYSSAGGSIIIGASSTLSSSVTQGSWPIGFIQAIADGGKPMTNTGSATGGFVLGDKIQIKAVQPIITGNGAFWFKIYWIEITAP